MSGLTVEFKNRVRAREAGQFHVSPPPKPSSKFRTNEDREADKVWESTHHPKPSTEGMTRNEKRSMRNQRMKYPAIGVRGDNVAKQAASPTLLTRKPLFDHPAHAPATASRSPSPLHGRASSAPSSGSPQKRVGARASRPSATSPSSFPAPAQSLPIRLEAQVLEHLASSLHRDEESGRVIGLDFPPRLPTARLELVNLNGVLDELMESIRGAMTKYETVTSTLISTQKQQAQEERDHRAVTAALQRRAGNEVDNAVALQLAFDTVLADLIRQSLKKTRRIHAFYQQHVLRVEEDCQLQLAEMREHLATVQLENDSLKVQQEAARFRDRVNKVQLLREGSEDMNRRVDYAGGQGNAGDIADAISVCLSVDLATQSSQYARLAKQVAEQLKAEREDGLKLISQLTSIIKDQEKLIKR